MAEFGSISLGQDASPAYKGDNPRKKLGFFRLICIVLFFIPYGLIYSLLGLYVLPTEAETLYPHDSGSALSFMFAITGISMMMGPAFGKISDVSEFRLGRRRPFIIAGTIFSAIAFAVMWWASIRRDGFLYMIFLFIAMTFLQLITNAQHGLLPDFVPIDSQGEASGIIAIFELTGSSLGFIYVLKYYDTPIEDTYLFFTLLIILSMTVTCFAANEVPGTISMTRRKKRDDHEETSPLIKSGGGGGQERRHSGSGGGGGSDRSFVFGVPVLTLSEISHCYYLDWGPKSHDFNLVFLSRFFYNLAISVQTFFLFFLRDVAEIKDVGHQKQLMAFAALTGQTVAAIVALPMGKLSDKIGRKLLIYFSSATMASTYLGFVFCNFAAKDPGPMFLIVAWSALYGVGNGCFLAVDTALALDVIPDKEEAAKAMGIWTTSGFLAVMLGPTFWFFAMSLGGKSKDGLGYNETGYDIMFTSACAFVIMAAMIVSRVKAVHRRDV